MEGTQRRAPESIAGARGFGLALALAVTPPRDASAATQADFDAIEAALDSAIASTIAVAPDLGSKADVFVKALTAAKDAVVSAATLDAQGDRRRAGSALRHAVRRVIGVGFRLRSLRGRRTIPDGTRQALLVEVQPIESSLRALRHTL